MKRLISCIIMLFAITACFAQEYTFTSSKMAKSPCINGKYVNPKITVGRWILTMGDLDLFIEGGAYGGKKSTRHYKTVSDVSESTQGNFTIGSAKAKDDAGIHCSVQLFIDNKTKRTAVVITYKEVRITYILDKN